MSLRMQERVLTALCVPLPVVHSPSFSHLQYYLESRKVWDEREAKAKESGSSTAAATAAGAGAAAGGQAGAAPMAVDGTPGPAGAASRTGAAATPFGGLGRTPAGSSGRCGSWHVGGCQLVCLLLQLM